MRIAEDAETAEFERMKRMMAAEEESLKGGLFEKIIMFYERWLRRALEHPVWLGGVLRDPDRGFLCVLQPAGHATCFRTWTRAASFWTTSCRRAARLQETNRVVTHVENIIESVPEVESTSRRTGLQLGLAAVTEPNTGDIAVKLKDKRSRGDR